MKAEKATKLARDRLEKETNLVRQAIKDAMATSFFMTARSTYSEVQEGLEILKGHKLVKKIRLSKKTGFPKKRSLNKLGKALFQHFFGKAKLTAVSKKAA